MVIVLEENYRGFQIRRHEKRREVGIVCTHCYEGAQETYANLCRQIQHHMPRQYLLLSAVNSGPCHEDGEIVMATSYLTKEEGTRVPMLIDVLKRAIDSLWTDAMQESSY